MNNERRPANHAVRPNVSKAKERPMTTDDERINYLADGNAAALADEERGDLDELRTLLADPSLWDEPDAALEYSVVDAIQAEARNGVAPPSTPVAGGRGRRWLRPVPIIGVAAAALVLIVALIAGIGNGSRRPQLAASLAGTALSPGARAHATLTQTTSGWRIELDASGLPRLDNGRFYEAWLKNQNGVLVPIGTFNQGGRIVMLWAGVSPRDFPTFTVTEESADGNQASSGRVVLVGTVTASR